MKDLGTLGRYRLRDKIASGGMAEVYRAHLSGVDGFLKEVAIKKILPNWSRNQEFIKMLVDEAKVLVHLTHPNIVQVFELNRDQDTTYLVMEYIDGVDLRNLLKRCTALNRKIPHQLIAHILREVLKALAYAHQKKNRKNQLLEIVHRDVSPQNILISLDGEVKLTDFGIAKVKGKQSETVVGSIKGKFAYMSPEQARAEALDGSSDLFSLAAVMYELLFGKRCFERETDLETLESVRSAALAFPEDQTLTEDVINLLRKGMSLNKQNRFLSSQEFIDALDQIWPSDPAVDAHQLKNLLMEVFPEKFEARWDDASQATYVHDRTIVEEKMPTIKSQQKTRVLAQASGDILRKAELPQHSSLTADRGSAVSLPGLSGKTSLIYMLTLGALFVAVIGLTYVVVQQLSTRASESQQTLVVRPPVKETLSLSASQTSSQSLPTEEVVITEEGSPPIVEVPKVPEKISLVVTAEPLNSNIKISSGELSASGQGQASLDILYEAKKSVLIQATAQGQQPFEETIELQANRPNIFRKIILKPLEYGFLTVGAKPWGRVSVTDFEGGGQTPMIKKRISAGSHVVTVIFPSSGKRVSKKILVSADQHIRCQAHFDWDARMDCR